MTLRRTLGDWVRMLARPIFYLGTNRLSQLGVVLTTTSAITILTFYTTEFFGVHVSPYAGILFFLVLPGFFVLGLLLIPLGIALRYRSERAVGLLPTEYPQIDFAEPKLDRKSTRLNSSHIQKSRMPSSA